MGMLDLLNGRDDIFNFLEGHRNELSNDLFSLLGALKSWRIGKRKIDVGESATLYRFLRFFSWVLCINKKFILRGTLRKRKICDNPEIIHWPIKKLLRLDSGTSQWASAAVLFGRNEQIEDPPFKLKLTYEAVEHWKTRRSTGKSWEPLYDETILRQAVAFLELIKLGKTYFLFRQAEDYCFARAFDFITKEQGESFFPSLRRHESDRIDEMERVIMAANNCNIIVSRDHRAVQAGSMLQKFTGKDVNAKHPECVSKSWPRFWDFIDDVPVLLKSV